MSPSMRDSTSRYPARSRECEWRRFSPRGERTLRSLPIDLGVEYIYGTRENNDGQKENADQLQMVGTFGFGEGISMRRGLEPTAPHRVRLLLDAFRILRELAVH